MQAPTGEIPNSLYEPVDAFVAFWRGLPRDDGTLIPHLRTALDHADPRIQPNIALIDVIEPALWHLRLFGTQRVSTFGKDLTGTDPLAMFADDIRAFVVDQVGTVLAHPCGWYNLRMITTMRGMEVRGVSASLPLATDPGAPPCVMNFTKLSDPVAVDDRQGRVTAVMEWRWIDIGAGTPD